MPGAVYNRAFDLATGQYGFVTTADMKGLGIHPNNLAVMAHRGLLEHRATGLYRVTAVPHTGLEQYMEATLWPRVGGVLSHETALDLYDISDINPTRIDITVPKGLRLRRANMPPVYRFHRRDLDPADIRRHEGIPIVTPLRAILDCVDIHVRHDLIEQAAGTARRRGMIRRADVALIEQQLGRSLQVTA
jgi:predicted transcriptional regulator of viral defense system